MKEKPKVRQGHAENTVRGNELIMLHFHHKFSLFIVALTLLCGCHSGKSLRERFFGKSLKARDAHQTPEKGHGKPPISSDDHGALSSKSIESFETGFPQDAFLNKRQIICLKFVQSIPNESYLYTIQSRLKQFHKQGKGAYYIGSHLRYRNLFSPEFTKKDQKDCARMVAMIDRFSEVANLQKETDDLAGLRLLHRKLALAKVANRRYPIRSCALLLSKIKTKRDYAVLKEELTESVRTPSPEVMMASLLQAQQTAGDNTARREISARGCIMALQNIADFNSLQRFADSTGREQLQQIKAYSNFLPQSSTVVAH